MASALYGADGIDYTDPEEVSHYSLYKINTSVITHFVRSLAKSFLLQLELLVTILIDLDAMDGKSSVSLLAECSSSPDVNTL